MNSIFNVKDHMLAGSRLLGLPDCPLIKVKDPVLRSYVRKGKWRHREDTRCDEIHSSDMRLGRGESKEEGKDEDGLSIHLSILRLLGPKRTMFCLQQLH